MIIRFLCPLGHRLTAVAQLAGKKVQCPVCYHLTFAPRPDPGQSESEKKAWDESDPDAHSTSSVFPGASAKTPYDDPASKYSTPPSKEAPPRAAKPQTAGKPQVTVPNVTVPQTATSTPPTTAPPIVPNVPVPQQTQTTPQIPAPQQTPIPQVPSPQQTPSQATPATPFDNMPELDQVSGTPHANPYASPKSRVEQTLAARAGKGKQQTLYMLTGALAFVVICSAIPAMGHLNLIAAPGWARVVLLVAALQMAYVVWVIALPDWSIVWVGMILFSLVAALYGGFWMYVVFIAPGAEMILSLHDLDRNQVSGWCATMVLLMGLMSYFCGRISNAWRREFELARTGRSSDPLADLKV